jgi:hypothetical protein
MSTSCRQRAYLYLCRDYEPVSLPPYDDEDLDRMAFDPDEATVLVGLTPTSTRRRPRFDGWDYEVPEVDTFDTEEVVTALLDAIEPYAAGLARARAELGLRAGVTVVIWSTGTTPAVCYRAETVRRLADLHLSLDHDQYVE